MKVLFWNKFDSPCLVMADSLSRHIFPQYVDIFCASGGSATVEPAVWRALEEIGSATNPITNRRPDSIDKLDLVIAFCKKQDCPNFSVPDAHQFFWPGLEGTEPSNSDFATLEKFRNLRDRIERYLLVFAQAHLQLPSEIYSTDVNGRAPSPGI
jgi:hypothetical protein